MEKDTDCTCAKPSWQYLCGEPDETGAILICSKCKGMVFVDIEQLPDFKTEYPDIKVYKKGEPQHENTKASSSFDNNAKVLKDYLVIENETGGFEIWPKTRYLRYIQYCKNRNLPIKISEITDFNQNDKLHLEKIPA